MKWKNVGRDALKGESPRLCKGIGAVLHDGGDTVGASVVQCGTVVNRELTRKATAGGGSAASNRGICGKVNEIIAGEYDMLITVWAFHFMQQAKDMAQFMSGLIVKASCEARTTLLLEIDDEVGVARVANHTRVASPAVNCSDSHNAGHWVWTGCGDFKKL